MNGLPGDALMGKTVTNRFILAITKEGSCGLYSPEVNGTAVEKMFVENSLNRKLSKERLGTETFVTYAIVHPSAAGDVRVVVTLRYSNLASIGGAWVSEVPEKMLKDHGIAAPDWPK